MSLLQKFQNGIFREFSVVIGIVFIIMMMIIPMPTIVLDLFISMNLLISIVIILNVLFIRGALEFSVFPSMLLISTVFSLALNISSTRLILTKGELFDGKIVRAFGMFVVGGGVGGQSLVVGAIIFVIIIAVQFLVITKGATRVSEVAARFALDALPGKQMAMEAEFNSGVITEDELIIRRRDLQREVAFYGSMDGASKFVSGNVKAGIFITLINIIGGLVIGIAVRGEGFAAALSNYVQLTVGDGLVSQLPALLISTSSGIIVTRSSSQGNLSEDINKEFTVYMRVYYIAGGILCLLGILPGFPWYVLLPIGTLLITAAVFSEKKQKVKVMQENKEQQAKAKSDAMQSHVQKLEPLDPISLEIGYDLVPLVQDENGQADLLNRISSIRRELGISMGIVIPLVRIIDNYLLDASEYSIKFSSIEMGRGTIRVNKLLAIQARENIDIEISGEAARDPTFGLPALWIDPSDRLNAQRAGYTVADSSSLISTHLSTLLENKLAELLTRQDTVRLIEQFAEKQPTVVDELKKHVNMGLLQRIFQRLLREKVSIRNLTALCETLSDFGEMTKDIDFLGEKARQALSYQIAKQYSDDEKVIYAYALNYELEQTILQSQETQQFIDPSVKQSIIAEISRYFSDPLIMTDKDGNEKQVKSSVLLVSEMARPIMHKMLASTLNKRGYIVPILSTLEIPDEYNVHIVKSVQGDIQNFSEEKTEEEVTNA